MLKSKLFPKDSERSRADKLLSNNRIEQLVLKTKSTKDLELNPVLSPLPRLKSLWNKRPLRRLRR